MHVLQTVMECQLRKHVTSKQQFHVRAHVKNPELLLARGAFLLHRGFGPKTDNEKLKFLMENAVET